MIKLIVPMMVLVFGFFSCTNPSLKKSETNNLPDTIGYFAARNMKGLGLFTIGESTYTEILIIIKEDIRKDSRRFKESNYKELPRYIGYEPNYMDFKYDKKGNIAGKFYREDFGSIFKEIKYDTVSSYLKEDLLKREIFGCPHIRELEMYEFYIGDIEMSSLELKFFNDTLYEIRCYQNDKIEEGFKVKYGIGKASTYSVKKGDKLLKIDEKIIWENNGVRAESQTYIEYKYEGDKYEGASYSNCFFKITSKNEGILREIAECNNYAEAIKTRLKEQSKQRDINQL